MLIDYEAPKPVSAYIDQINAELDELIAAGDGKATQLVVPTTDAARVKREFAKAANAKEKTARVRLEESDGKVDKEGVANGNTTLVFTLSPKHKARNRKGGTVDTGADVPEGGVTAE